VFGVDEGVDELSSVVRSEQMRLWMCMPKLYRVEGLRCSQHEQVATKFPNELKTYSNLSSYS
jgi:hypothetical protein